jgi:hypothetical protein
MSLTIQQINSAIITGTWTNDQLSSMIDAVKYARAQLAKDVKRSFNVGAKVQFTSSRTGRTMQGTVSKIAIKNIIVDTTEGRWKVPANMLEAA